MELITLESPDNQTIIAFLSSPKSKKKGIIIHAHGFGGDALSNKFVRVLHKSLPSLGWDFVSFNSRLSGYINEQYSEAGVRCVGASCIDYEEEALIDLTVLINWASKRYDRVILQGHSFGTNLVKKVMDRDKSKNFDFILLSPADSDALYRKWCRNSSDNKIRLERQSLYWNKFGILVDDQDYEIPMTGMSLETLLSSEIFHAWSGEISTSFNNGIVIIGSGDPISNFGNTKSKPFFNEHLPNAQIKYIDKSGHTFCGFEIQLEEVLRDYLVNLY